MHCIINPLFKTSKAMQMIKIGNENDNEGGLTYHAVAVV
jgi:hypothetical protein